MQREDEQQRMQQRQQQQEMGRQQERQQPGGSPPGGSPPGGSPHEQRVESLLGRVLDAIIEPPRSSPTQSVDEIIVRVVRVLIAGTPVQGPDIPVPKGFSVTVRQRRHVGTITGYVAGSRNAIAQSLERSELRDNDPYLVNVSNLKNLWFDADAIPALGFFTELIVAQ